MSLKYYRDEAARYGSMGNMTVQTMHDALEKACVHFGVPRIELKIAGTKRRFSWYRGGLGMIAMNLRQYPAMALPTIKMAPNHMIWQVFCHEFAHHVHTCRNDAKWRTAMAKDVNWVQAQSNLGVNVTDSSPAARQARFDWLMRYGRKEHAHGPSHRSIMQEVVNYFLSIGMITVMPTYMQPKTTISINKLAA